jgi:hypothetical protein
VGVWLGDAMRDSIDDLESLDLPPNVLLKEAEQLLSSWKKRFGSEPDIPRGVQRTLINSADTLLSNIKKNYPDAAAAAQPFDPQKFADKVRTRVQENISQGMANRVKMLPGMQAMDKFAAFAGLPSVSGAVNQKLGGALGRIGLGRGGTLDVEQSKVREAQTNAAARVRGNAQQNLTAKMSLLREERGRGAGNRAARRMSALAAEKLQTPEGLESVNLSPARGTGGEAGGLESPTVVRILTDIRNILAGQFNYQKQEDAQDERDAKSAEAKSELDKESTVTPDYSYYTKAPASMAGAPAADDSTSPKKVSKKAERKALVKEAIAKRVAAGGGGGSKMLNVLGKAPAVPMASTVATVGAEVAGTAGAAGGLTTMLSAVTSGLSGLAAALGPIVLIVGAVAAGLYVLYNVVKQLELGKIFAPVIKYFKLFADVLMTVGRVAFKTVVVPLKILGTIIGVVLNPILKGLAAVLTPVVDGMTWLWENGLKPLLEGFEAMLDWLGSIPMLGGKFKKKEAAPAGPAGGAAYAGAMPAPAATAAPTGAAPAGAAPTSPAPAPSTDMGGLNIKSSESTAGGPTHPGVVALAHDVQSSIPGFTRFTSFNDSYHQGLKRGSQHKKGLAMDFTIADPEQSGQAVAAVQKLAKDRGVNVRVLDEYKTRSKGATGGHIHVEFADEQMAAKMLDGVQPGVPLPAGGGGAEAPALASAAPAGGGGGAAPVAAPTFTRAATPVSAGSAAVAAGQAAAPAIIMAGMQGAQPPAPPSIQSMMPIPIPIRPRNDDSMLRALFAVNAV